MLNNLQSQIDARLKELAAENKFSGTIGMQMGENPFFSGAYGYRDRENHLPMEINTKINLGSINKSFTAIAICQLEQNGWLNFHDAADKFLPEIAPISRGCITISHLLMHKSGLGNYMLNADYQAAKHSIDTVSKWLPYAIEPISALPGLEENYSNSGYIVLGAIIERVSGMDYYDYIDKNIYNICEMGDTGCFLNTQNIENRARGYFMPESTVAFMPNDSKLPLRGGPAGGGYSTAPDMLRYMAALRSDSLISNTFATICPPGQEYGFAAMRFLSGAIGHTGGTSGISAYFGAHPISGHNVVALSNVDMGVFAAVPIANEHIGIAPKN